MLLLIDENGKLADCTVVVSSNSPLLDATSCKILTERATFVPARDEKGAPTRDNYFTPKVVYRQN